MAAIDTVCRYLREKLLCKWEASMYGLRRLSTSLRVVQKMDDRCRANTRHIKHEYKYIIKSMNYILLILLIVLYLSDFNGIFNIFVDDLYLRPFCQERAEQPHPASPCEKGEGSFGALFGVDFIKPPKICIRRQVGVRPLLKRSLKPTSPPHQPEIAC